MIVNKKMKVARFDFLTVGRKKEQGLPGIGQPLFLPFIKTSFRFSCVFFAL